MYGRRVPKSNRRVDAYGCIDELSAALGLARAFSSDKFISEQVFAVQKELIVVMGELATLPEDRPRYIKDGFEVTNPKMVDRITAVIANLEEDKSLYPKDWAIPGGTTISAALDLARTTCRRAERRVASWMDDEEKFNPEILRYLNRLSDLCWILARYAERRKKRRRR